MRIVDNVAAFAADRLFASVSAVLAIGYVVLCQVVLCQVVLCQSAFAQKPIDPAQKPLPAKVKEFTFPKFEEVRLANGLKVFIIEDHEQPVVAFRLQIAAGSVREQAAKSGLASMTAQLLTQGAGKRSAAEIAQILDGLGVNLSASAGRDALNVFTSGLKKHLPLLLEIFADVVQRPTFPDDEIAKMREQQISALRAEKAQPMSLAGAMAAKVLYGEAHPYAIRATEGTVTAISKADIQGFHAAFVRPNIASLAVMGDITKEEILPLLEATFAGWQQAAVPPAPALKPTQMPHGVYLVERPNSVQSTIVMCSLAPEWNSAEYERTDVAADVLGSGFGGRLFRTLRETYSYTYAPFGYVSQRKGANMLLFGASVRNTVTDSAISVTQKELRRLATETPPEAELMRLKRYKTGNYLMAFERSEFVATLLQDADLNAIPVQRVKMYPLRILAMQPKQIRDIAAKYMNPDKMSLVVVGSPDVLPALKQFGTVYRYKTDLLPAPEYDPVELTFEELRKRHVEALGGDSAVRVIKSVFTKSEVEMRVPGQRFSGTMVMKQTASHKFSRALEIAAIAFEQRSWFNGTKAFEQANMMGQDNPPAEKKGKDADALLFDAQIFPVLTCSNLGFMPELLGKKEGVLVVKITSPAGSVKFLSFDPATYLITKIEEIRQTPQGVMSSVQEYKEYTTVSGVKMPSTIKLMTGPAVMNLRNTFETNVAIDEKEFLPEK